MLVKQMARELAVHGIRVNSIAPGIVATGMAKQLMSTDKEFARLVGSILPMGDLQKPSEIATAVSFLLSPDAAAMTGSTLQVDGGLSLYKFD